MNIYCICLLLLLALLTCSEGPQHTKLFDPSVCPIELNSTIAQLGVLAPGLPQNEVFRSDLPQTEVFKFILPQTEVFKSVPAYKSESLSKRVQNIISEMRSLFDLGVKGLTSTLIHGGEKSCWAVRIALECLQHVLKMYTWSLSENQALVHLRCRLIGLFLKQSLYKKHDFAASVHKLYQGSQNLHFWHLRIFSICKNKSQAQIQEEPSNSFKRYHFYGGGKALIFSSDELISYTEADLGQQQYQFLRCVKSDDKKKPVLHDNSDILCNVPIDVLAPKLTLKCAKELATLHNIYMPSKVLLKDAHTLLQDHKCHMCGEFLALFQP
jgi:hypothetical protein